MVISKKILDLIFRESTVFGGSVFYGLVLLVTLVLQEHLLFLKPLFGLIFTFLITILIRVFYFKNRPEKQKYGNFVERIQASSFPSWHTARIVYLAIIISYLFSNNYLTILLIIIAGLVAYSRIYLKRHDYWDVLGGIVLGIIAFWLSGLI